MNRTAIALTALLVLPQLVEAKIHRSAASIAEFKRQQPCPSTGKPSGQCKGWVIDHVKALACGGADKPSNMQWQSIADAKADKWERRECWK